MASVIDSIKRFYTEKDSLYNNLILLIIILAIVSLFLFLVGGDFNKLPKDSSVKIYAYILSTLISFFGAGYLFQIMENRINDEEVIFEEINFSIIKTSFDALGFLVVYVLISFVIGLLPIIGSLISPFIMTPMFVKYAATYNTSYALNWTTTKNLIRPMFLPILILGLKMLVMGILCLTPIIFFAVMFFKTMPAVVLALVFYVIAVTWIVYSDNLAQIYTEVADSYSAEDV